jgi:hypothetical protein
LSNGATTVSPLEVAGQWVRANAVPYSCVAQLFSIVHADPAAWIQVHALGTLAKERSFGVDALATSLAKVRVQQTLVDVRALPPVEL